MTRTFAHVLLQARIHITLAMWQLFLLSITLFSADAWLWIGYGSRSPATGDSSLVIAPQHVICQLLGTIVVYASDHYGETGVMKISNDALTATIVVLSSLGVVALRWADVRFWVSVLPLTVACACYDRVLFPRVVRMPIKRMFPLSKTVFVPTVHLAWMSIVLGRVPPLRATLALVIHCACPHVHNDIKDVQEDRSKGVVTLPTLVGVDSTRRIIVSTYIVLATGAFRFGMDELVTPCFVVACAQTACVLGRMRDWQYFVTHVAALPVASAVRAGLS